ncbi:MAG TPA: hypothetical protein VMW54_15750 [Terriglobia bacterium]|nr:hypothetical protein [Terriglobia bacterium]
MRILESTAKVFAGQNQKTEVFIYLAAIGAAICLAVYPLPTFGAMLGVAGLILSAFALRRLNNLDLWQVLMLVALAGFIILNYGFVNLTFYAGGIPIIVGHSLVFAALGLAVFKSRGKIFRVLRDPAALCLLAMLPLAILHLMIDVPRYGLYAIRDASMFLETIFILLGLFWSTRERDALPLVKWLFFIFIVSMAYGMTFPWGDAIRTWSPVSGIFLKIPVIGYYWGTAVQMLGGALLVICLGAYVVKWRAWVLFLLAGAQIFGLAIQQARAMYIALILSLILFLIMGELKKFAKLATMVGIGLVAVMLITSVAGLRIEGRVGPVSDQFIKEHLLSLLGRRDTPAVGSIYDREDWYEQTKTRIESHSTAALLIGEGFGFPLIDFVTPTGVPVRQPHNSNLTVLLRLGLLGLGFWIAFNVIVLTRFIRALKNKRSMDRFSANVVLWLFLYYLICFIEWSVQPGLEFSAGAITVYFLVGFALGTMRREGQKQPAEQPWQASVYLEDHGSEEAVPQLVD